MTGTTAAMTSRNLRPALALAALAAAVLAHPSSAAAKRHLVTDPTGDALVPLASHDIVSADLATRGTTRVVRGKRVYTPTTLVATVTLAGSPTVPGLTVHFNDFLSSCDGGFLRFYYQAPAVVPVRDTVSALHKPPVDLNDCSPGTLTNSVGYEARVSVRGNAITWELPLATIPGKLTPGTGLFNPEVVVYQDEPATGFYTTDFVTGPANLGVDTATSEQRYVIG